MAEALLIVGIIGVIITIIAWLISLKIQRQGVDRIQAQQQAWERAQEVRQQQWRVQQEKRHADQGKSLATHIQQLHGEWQTWTEQEQKRAEELRQEREAIEKRKQLEFELSRLPRVEDTPLPRSDGPERPEPPWRLPSFQGADLSERDLSSRYLGHADLRGARLVNARLFTANLSWACLAGADLSGADLSATNLTHADLRGALFNGTNLLVADLNNAVLIGADLRGARNLTLEQLHSAVFDSTTKLDPAIDITLPRTPLISPTERSDMARSYHRETEPDLPISLPPPTNGLFMLKPARPQPPMAEDIQPQEPGAV
ncbi:MAG TPA: pentapeptide repeat-containing protein [Ktedonobacteraceae bacterium]|nr:pentapeptide repeat-containing protein [Ktedonobacteraceae bacterium]